MSKFKPFLLFLLLAAITVCVIFLPQFLSDKKEESLLGKTDYGNYNTENRGKITSNQVALLVYNRGIDIGTYNPIHLEDISGESSLKEDSEKLFEIVFQGDEGLQADMKSLLQNDKISYSRSSVLTMIDNQPIALSFIEVGIKGETGVVSYIYEEKTKALIYFSYSAESKPIESEADGEIFWGRLLLCMNEYYKEQLKLDSNQFYYSGEILEIVKNEMPESDNERFLMNCFADFGISRRESDEFKEEDVIGIYN